MPFFMLRLLLLAALALAGLALALDVSWLNFLKPGTYSVGFSACVFENYVAVVGGADGMAYVAILDKDSGRRIEERIADPPYFYGCAASNGVLYVAGNPGLYAFDAQLNTLSVARPDGVVYMAVAATDGYVYAVGSYDDKLYVEKRTAELTLVANVTYIEEGWDWAEAYGVAVDPLTNNVWVVGHYDDGLSERPLVLTFDPNLRLIRKVEVPEMEGFFANVCFMGGYAYISGNRTVLKFDRSGNLVKWERRGGQLACASNRLVVFWHAELVDGVRLGYTVLDADLNVLKTDILTKTTDIRRETAFYAPGSPDSDGKRAYAAAVVDVRRTASRNTTIAVFAVPADVSIVQQVPVLRTASLLKLIAIIGIVSLSIIGWALNWLKKRRAKQTQPATS